MSFLQALVRTARPSLRLSRRAFHTTLPRKSAYRPVLLCGAALLFSTGVLLASAPTIHLDSEVAPHHDTDTLVDPETSITFPKSMRVPSKLKIPAMTLLGVGVRRVSLLKVKVYSIGFYADLENPNLKIPLDMAPDEKLEYIIRNTNCVLRIVPTRTTSYTHLRDAFMRAMQGRLALAKKNGTLSDDEAQEVGSPMRKLKTLFPNSPIEKHTPLDVFLAAPVSGRPRPLVFRDLGAVESDWVATELVLHYFDGASPPLKNMVLECLKSFET